MNRHLLLLLPPILCLSLAFHPGSSHSVGVQADIGSAQPEIPVSLPIYLEENTGVISVSWHRPEVEGISHFLVERQHASSSFVQVGGLNVHASEDRYEFRDLLPIEGPSVLRYRVKLVFQDGSYVYSAVKQIIPSVSSRIEVANLGHGTIEFQLPVKVDQAQIEIRSVAGALVRESAFSGQTGQVSLAGLPSGNYLMVVTTGDMSWEVSLSHS